jgi:hypothetical protein
MSLVNNSLQEEIMNNRNNKSEKGQAIVYLVLGIVVFFGFVALAIDGGMVLADRRHAQNAADAASLAGGSKAADIISNQTCPDYFSCGISGTAEDAAIQRAGDNNFIIDHNLSDHNGAHASCVDTSLTRYLDVTVEISATTPSNFLQLVYPSALHNDVEAVTRVYPARPIGPNAAVIALNPDDCKTDNGVTVTGSGDVTVNGGGIFSNGCVQGGGTPATVKVTKGNIEGQYNDPQNTTFTPAIGTAGGTLDFNGYYIPPPVDDTGKCLGTSINQITTNLAPGLYCLKASDVVNKSIIAKNVTIYLSGNVHLTFSSGNKFDFEAPTDNTYAPAIPGVLIYAANGANITINGDSDDTFAGLIYAPDSPSQILLNGSANFSLTGQMIGWNVKINGSNNMTVDYDACTGYIKPTTLELHH